MADVCFFVDINDLDGGEQHSEPILMALSQTFNRSFSQMNEDGSIGLYFGPDAPGNEAGWLATIREEMFA